MCKKQGKDWKHGFFLFNFTIKMEYHVAVKINQMSHGDIGKSQKSSVPFCIFDLFHNFLFNSMNDDKRGGRRTGERWAGTKQG